MLAAVILYANVVLGARENVLSLYGYGQPFGLHVCVRCCLPPHKSLHCVHDFVHISLHVI